MEIFKPFWKKEVRNYQQYERNCERIRKITDQNKLFEIVSDSQKDGNGDGYKRIALEHITRYNLLDEIVETKKVISHNLKAYAIRKLPNDYITQERLCKIATGGKHFKGTIIYSDEMEFRYAALSRIHDEETLKIVINKAHSDWKKNAENIVNIKLENLSKEELKNRIDNSDDYNEILCLCLSTPELERYATKICSVIYTDLVDYPGPSSMTNLDISKGELLKQNWKRDAKYLSEEAQKYPEWFFAVHDKLSKSINGRQFKWYPQVRSSKNWIEDLNIVFP